MQRKIRVDYVGNPTENLAKEVNTSSRLLNGVATNHIPLTVTHLLVVTKPSSQQFAGEGWGSLFIFYEYHYITTKHHPLTVAYKDKVQ